VGFADSPVLGSGSEALEKRRENGQKGFATEGRIKDVARRGFWSDSS